MKFSIAGREIGPEHPPLVIAEIGVNHDGSLERALALVDAAAAAGADVAKFQCHMTEYEMVPTDMKPGELSDERLWDIIKRVELREDEELRIRDHCAKLGMIYLSTPFSREAADRLNSQGVPAFKIGSGECNNHPLLDHIARFGKPMIVSTGMNDLATVKAALDVIGGRVPVALLHSTSMYPTPYSKVRLGAVADLKNTFPGNPIGVSDHSTGVWTAIGAVALGACIVEKHFTLLRNGPGPDSPISIEPDELRDLVVGVRAVWEARGGKKTVLAEEKPVIDFAFATVVSIADIEPGDVLDKDNIWVKRPGTGKIPAERLGSVLGKRAKTKIPANLHLSPEQIEDFSL